MKAENIPKHLFVISKAGQIVIAMSFIYFDMLYVNVLPTSLRA